MCRLSNIKRVLFIPYAVILSAVINVPFSLYVVLFLNKCCFAVSGCSLTGQYINAFFCFYGAFLIVALLFLSLVYIAYFIIYVFSFKMRCAIKLLTLTLITLFTTITVYSFLVDNPFFLK